MSTYAADQERAIRVQRRVDDWARSGLLTDAQRRQIAAGLQVDLRRTNRFLRVTLIGFGLLIIGAAVGLVIVLIDPDREETVGVLCLCAAALMAALAELLIGRFRLYRFGIEEACAIGAVLLAGVGSGMMADWPRAPIDTLGAPVDWRVLTALLAGSAAAFAAFRRYGYLYGAFAAMLGVGLAPFQLGLPAAGERLASAAVLVACLAAARPTRRLYGDEFPGDGYGWIQAAAWFGIYASLNLRLDLTPFGRADAAWLVWFTYAMIWILPAAGLWLSIRERDRPLLDVSLLMLILTLITNKPYLGLERQPWDPILFGVLLVGIAVVVRRWLGAGAGGTRWGFTATRQLHSEKELPATAAIAAGTFHPGPEPRHAQAPEPDPFEGRGGRSGGGGAGDAF